MNNTAKYISELLYRYECVILPGFGAFLTKRQPAVIQESTHAFFPPQKLISFNRQLQNNDGLIANYIATAENISYTDAVAKIQRYVLSLNNKMSLGKRVELDGIGSFFTSVEDTLQFEPSQDTNYLTEAFGLNSFISPSIIREEKVVPNAVMTEVTREVYKKQIEAIEETTPITFTPERRRERPYLRYAAAIVILFGLGSLGLNEFNKRIGLYNDGLSIKADKEIENRIQEATFDISSPLPAINLNIVKAEEDNSENMKVNSTITSGKYHVVAGAYRIKANANKKVQKLKAKGFDARLIGVNKYGLHQVSYTSHENKLEALKALQNIKKQQDSRAWLLVQDL